MSMEVRKESQGLKNSMVTNEELAAINAFAKRELKADEVYTFAVRLCDNEVDRDGERFPRATLEELAELFVGKSGIFDHEWTARGQAARIYRTEVVEEEGLCSVGEKRCYLKGYAYMLRGGANDGLIGEIEGGIKKEVSVGCSVVHLRRGDGRVHAQKGRALRRKALLRGACGGAGRLRMELCGGAGAAEGGRFKALRRRRDGHAQDAREAARVAREP